MIEWEEYMELIMESEGKSLLEAKRANNRNKFRRWLHISDA